MSQRKTNLVAYFHLLALVNVIAASVPAMGAEPSSPPARLSNQAVILPGGGYRDAAGLDVIDWNRDGLLDLYIHDAGSNAVGTIYLNTGSPTQPAFSPVGIPHQYNCTETFPQTIEHSQSRAFCDLNHDGLPDLILFDGLLRYLPNTGHRTAWNLWHLWKGPGAEYFPGSPAMLTENDRLSASPESMFWDKGIFARQVITFAAGDFDADGLQDMIVSRMTDEQPGVQRYAEMWNQWTPRGRIASKIVRPPAPPFDGKATLSPLDRVPERQTFFYRNVGSKDIPHFDKAINFPGVTAPNPVIVDMDGDGLPDLLSSEAPYACNSFRVDWPTTSAVVWFRRLAAAEDGSPLLAPAQQLLTTDGKPIPSGTMARLADLRSSGKLDLLVMDPDASIRWYINAAPKGQTPRFQPAGVLRGDDFPRFGFMFQPILVNWFGPNSRDLILHGVTDPHCKWGLRRTTLYKNVATKPGEIRYQRVGDLNFNGDPSIVHPREQETPYGVYGSYAAVMPDGAHGKRLLMSVDGKVFLFSDLAPDGLTFRKSMPIPLAARRDVLKGTQKWSLSPQDADKAVSFIRISNTRNALRFIHLQALEAIAADDGRNVATRQQGASIANTYPPDARHWEKVGSPDTMLTPGALIDEKTSNATTFGFTAGPAIIKLAAPTRLRSIGVRIADRDAAWYQRLVPFQWQGKTYRMVDEIGQYWTQLKIEISTDGKSWNTIVDATTTEMSHANPVPIDWDRDGRTDLVVAALGKNEFLYPTTLSYRLYLNQGTEESPVFGQPIFATTEKSTSLLPRVPWTAGYAPMASLKLVDMDGDGKLDLLVEAPEPTRNIVQWHRNISSASAGFVFESAARELRNDTRPFSHNGRYRYFDYADVDGDGVRDLLNAGSVYQRLYLIKGIHSGAPAAVTDMTVDARTTAGTVISWTRPVGSESFDMRWSVTQPVSEINWYQLAAVAGPYTVATGQRQQVTLPPQPGSRRCYVSVKSLSTNQHSSSASSPFDFVPAPATVLLLANGLPNSDVGNTEPYAGCIAVTVNQDNNDPRNASHKQNIAVLNPDPILSTGKPQPNASVTLLRFDALPTKAVRAATVRLTAVPEKNAVRLDDASAMSCSVVELPAAIDWSAVTWQQFAPGQPWPADYLLKNARFLAFGNPTTAVMTRDPVLRWDVTEGVNRAISQGRSDVIFLIRLDYTGHYTAGGTWFYPADAKSLATRPALELVSESQ